MREVAYSTVFDITTAGFRGWSGTVFGLVFVAFALLMSVMIRSGIIRTISPLTQRWFPRLLLGFALLWTTVAFFTTYADYSAAVTAMANHRAQMVQGVVENFRPMPASGHAMESFTVNGAKFEYSDYAVTAGFNQTASHGGPIREGLSVRIWHWRGEILRLDVARTP